MKLTRWTSFVLLCMAAVLVAACVRTTEGVPVAGEAGPGVITSSPPSAPTLPTPEADPSMYGVVPTFAGADTGQHRHLHSVGQACGQDDRRGQRSTCATDHGRRP